jgi:hypothetical protein
VGGAVAAAIVGGTLFYARTEGLAQANQRQEKKITRNEQNIGKIDTRMWSVERDMEVLKERTKNIQTGQKDNSKKLDRLIDMQMRGHRAR